MRRYPTVTKTLLVFLLVLAAATVTTAGGRRSLAAGPKPPTVAEETDYRATASPEQVRAYLRALAAQGNVELETIGRTVEGRPILAAAIGRGPTVLLLGGIHSGECAGKEAILALLRDLAVGDAGGKIIESVRILAVPDFNVDGNARRGKHHRPGQIGPEQGVGWRTNAQRLDLNRDFAKLETPEVRALVRLMQRSRPVLFVDAHTTDGSVHAHDILLDIPHHPAVPAQVTAYLEKRLVPEVRARLHKTGYSANWYGNFVGDRSRWQTFGFGARYSTEYAGLRGTPALLLEAYSRIPYRRRVQVTRAALEAALQTVAEDVDRLRQLVAEARQAAGAVAGKDLPVDGELTERGKVRIRVPAGDGVETVKVPYLGRVKPTVQVRVPRFYAIDAEESRLVHRLMMHGIPVFELTAGAMVGAQELVVERLEKAERPFQGHRLLHVQVEERERTLPLRPGTFLVPTNHALGILAAVLLEPASPDSLVSWNFLDHRIERGRPLPIWRLPEAPSLHLQPVANVPRRTHLTLDLLFDPEKRVPFSGPMPPTVVWLPEGGQCLIRVGDMWRRFSVESGAEEAYYDWRALARAWSEVEGVSKELANSLAKRGWDVLSPDGKSGILTRGRDLYHVDLRSHTVRRLTDDPAREELALFSPDGKKVAYVKNYNLYVYDLEEQREVRLTEGGSEEKRYGKLDWVYQEEIYGRGNYRAFWWAPDGSHLAFLYLDETWVPRYPIVHHLPVHARLEQEFYPKVGDPLPKVRLGVVPARGGDVAWVDVKPLQGEEELLIVRVGFVPDSSRVWFQVQNREQTWLKLALADLRGDFQGVVVEEESPAWVEVLGEPVWLDEGRFLWLSDRSGNRHVYLVELATKKVVPVTQGDWEVLDLYGADSEGKYAWVRGTPDDSTAPSVYRVRLEDGQVERVVGARGSARARFSRDKRYFVAHLSSIDTPPQAWFYAADGRRLWALAPNLVDYHHYLEPTPVRMVRVPARDGFPLNCMLILPSRFDPSRKYPVLCYVYGGPQAPVVQKRWAGTRQLWFQMLAQKGIAVWVCDNRASSYRGIKHAYKIYGQMGFQELADIEDSLRWLFRQPWVDSGRVAIHGWSYGGFMAAFALTHSRLFRLGLSGAPVTDWRNYDAIYTERYMRLLSNNKQGYERTSVVRAAGSVTGRLVLIHGTIDDNVHPANTLQLAHALQLAGKQFDMMLYPASRHGVGHPRQLRHLYGYMTELLREELLGDD